MEAHRGHGSGDSALDEGEWEEVNRPPEYGREAYGWRHEVRGKPSPTLRISRKVLEEYPPFAVAELLDRLNVAAAIRARPDARYVVIHNGMRVTLEEALR